MSLQTVPAPIAHRFTRREYQRMDEAGLFRDERVELLDGAVMTLPPQSPSHASVTNRIAAALLRLTGPTVHVRIQAPILLDDWSEPEPDVVLCAPAADDYAHEHPNASQIRLVIEVAAASLAYDRGRKQKAYAESGIPAYWIVNLGERRIEVFSDPDRAAGAYLSSRTVGAGESLSLPTGQTLAAAALLPRE